MYLTQSLHRLAQGSPDQVTTHFEGRSVTNAETIGIVSRLAGGLRELGTVSGARVGLLAGNSDRFLQLLYAIPWADGVILPINTRWSTREIAYSINEAECEVLFVDRAWMDVTPALRDVCPGLKAVVQLEGDTSPIATVGYDELVASSKAVPDFHRGGDALAAILYTGGTTGFPKGVMLSHRGLCVSAFGLGLMGRMRPRGRVLHAAPMFHLGDMASWILHSSLGATHVIIPQFDPVASMRAIQEQRVSHLMMAPIMLQMITDHPNVDDFDLTSVNGILYGTSPISDALLERCRLAFSEAEFVQAYGMTELSPTVTVLDEEGHRDPKHRRSAGRVAPHALVKVVDQQGEEVPRGTFGEVIATGENVMLGYWKKPAETAEAIRDGWIYTGDGGYMDEDGYLYISDRIKDMIITGGENVFTSEVENAVASHPSVAQCAVIGVPDEVWGERVHLVVKLHAGTSATLLEIQTHCRAEIAGYKIPRSMTVVDEFPTSGTGKILKRELRRVAAS